MNIKVLGTGCPKCKKLEEIVKKAVNNSNIDCTIEKVKDIADIMTYGVMLTPALVIDNKVVLAGELPTVEKMEKILNES